MFEEFRYIFNECYELEPAWYFTAPGLARDAALTVTNAVLEPLRDPDMLLRIEKRNLWRNLNDFKSLSTGK